VKRLLDDYQRSWLLAGAGFVAYAAATLEWGWSLDPGSVRGLLWSLGMVCFGCAIPAALDTLARLRKPKPTDTVRRSLT